MSIWAHTLVKNEENFVWFSVMSVIEHVDKILVYDTGSTDKTVEIVKEIKKRYPQKVVFREVGNVDINEFTKVRQQMLNETKSDWFLIVDGDEIWWKNSITKLTNLIIKSGKKYESIVVPTHNLVGDIFHYQEERAGLYKLAGKKGHLALRAVKRDIPGLKSDKPHGTWGWTDGVGRMIQDRNQKKIKFINASYLHASFLKRSNDGNEELVPKRKKKLKYEIGVKFPLDFYYPEVFFKPRPDIVPSPWIFMNNKDFLLSVVQTPARKLKRRLFRGGVGY